MPGKSKQLVRTSLEPNDGAHEQRMCGVYEETNVRDVLAREGGPALRNLMIFRREKVSKKTVPLVRLTSLRLCNLLVFALPKI